MYNWWIMKIISLTYISVYLNVPSNNLILIFCYQTSFTTYFLHHGHREKMYTFQYNSPQFLPKYLWWTFSEVIFYSPFRYSVTNKQVISYQSIAQFLHIDNTNIHLPKMSVFFFPGFQDLNCWHFNINVIKNNNTVKGVEKSQHGCVRWALCEHLTSPCHDFACGGLRNEIICSDILLDNYFFSEWLYTFFFHFFFIFIFSIF